MNIPQRLVQCAPRTPPGGCWTAKEATSRGGRHTNHQNDSPAYDARSDFTGEPRVPRRWGLTPSGKWFPSMTDGAGVRTPTLVARYDAAVAECPPSPEYRSRSLLPRRACPARRTHGSLTADGPPFRPNRALCTRRRDSARRRETTRHRPWWRQIAVATGHRQRGARGRASLYATWYQFSTAPGAKCTQNIDSVSDHRRGKPRAMVATATTVRSELSPRGSGTYQPGFAELSTARGQSR